MILIEVAWVNLPFKNYILARWLSKVLLCAFRNLQIPPDLLILAAVSCLWCYKNIILYFYLFRQKCISLIFDTNHRCTISSFRANIGKAWKQLLKGSFSYGSCRKTLPAVSRCPQWMKLTPRTTDSECVSTMCIMRAGVTQFEHQLAYIFLGSNTNVRLNLVENWTTR